MSHSTRSTVSQRRVIPLMVYDTLAASRRKFRHLPNHQLHTVTAECGYCLENHHHALADAEACAAIALEIL